ncbi:hypothetical protein UFOVP270_40 [uncultured Caudovirales phage]|uniref:Uncharacterized protein n=1 Tax=uncultured Caudovirales phage TaxID=2100421 RepID=A0A6J5L667_9CAUD|nr:hypothetical protein UFOVP101_16 [uncultured Caudovirales phage]CAB4134293.1 hypothetical protein UFOVP270_40 [uncultured Caudovirales phage]
MKGYKNEYSPKKGKADVYPSHPRGCNEFSDSPYDAIEKVAKYRSDPLAHHMMSEAPHSSRGEYKVRMVKDPNVLMHESGGKEDY